MGGNAERIHCSSPGRAPLLGATGTGPRAHDTEKLSARPRHLGRALALVALSLASCSSPWRIQELHTDLEDFRKHIEAPAHADVDAAELVPVRAAMHIHSKFSHDSDGSIRDIARAARAAGVQVIFLTDHTNPDIFERGPEGWVDGVFFVRGEEVSKKGSILALGTRASIPRGQSSQEIIDGILDQEGVAAIGHLDCTDPRLVTDYDAVSVRNLHADVKRIPVTRFPGMLLDALIYGKGRSNELVLRHLIRVEGPELSIWDELLAQRPVSAIAEVDAHEQVSIFGMKLDSYRLSLRVLHQFLLVPRDWTKDDLLAAVRAGRSYIGFSLIGDPTGFVFGGSTPEGTAILVGDELAFQPGMRLSVRAPAPARIFLLKDGHTCASVRGRELDFECLEPGVYRAEARVKLDGHTYPWILSNPIYVRAAEPDPRPEPALPDPTLLTQTHAAKH